MDLTRILEVTVSPNVAEIQEAEKLLEQLATQDMCNFLKLLATELAHTGKSMVARMAAGLQFKNRITSKDPEVKAQYQNMWLSFPQQDRNQIKQLILQALGTETTKATTAPQCVAYIASVELPNNLWPELINSLSSNVTNPQSPETLKAASLDSIGYICEEINADYLSVYSNEILTAIVQGMRKEEPSFAVRLAATKALYNSLEFTKSNFDKDAERHFIMQVVCEATQCPNEDIVVAALQNLVKIMSLYYQYMEMYMGPALFAITLEAMKSPSDNVALQAIEFWSTVCDEEQDLAIEAMEATELGKAPSQVSCHYVQGALQFLIPILLLTLAKQEETDDEDDWNPCKAAGVCLSLMANCTTDLIIQFVMPFVNENLVNVDWRYRDAAVMALGCIMEGPDPEHLFKFISQIIMKVIDLMQNDSVVQVKDSAAWTIGRICEQTPAVVLQSQVIETLLQALTTGLERESRVATNVCWAFSSLAEAAYEYALNNDPSITSDDPETYPLSSSFEIIITKVIATANRPDSAQNNLRTAAYEALMDLIKYSPKDCYVAVQKTALHIIESLKNIVTLNGMELQGSDKQQILDLESLLCATLQTLLRKMTKVDILQISDTVMTLLLSLLSTTGAGQTGGVQEDAILTIGAIVESLGDVFEKYMNALFPFLLLTLKNYQDVQVCLAAIGLVGDLCRSISIQIFPYTNDIMQILVDELSNANVHRSIKPPILSTIGDIALAIGSQFKTYLNPVLAILEQASSTPVQQMNLDMIEYVNELKEGCLECYTGIIQGLKGDKENEIHADVQQLIHHLPWMLTFIDNIGNDQHKSDSNIACAAGLLGDLLTCFGSQLIPHISSKPGINKLLNEGKHSRNKRTKTLTTWAMKSIKQLQGDTTTSKAK